MSFARAVLALSALAFAGIGAAFLLAPADMGTHVDVALGSVTAHNDVRAVYGGLQLGVALWLALAAARGEWLRPALLAQLCVFGGLFGARLLSLALDGRPSDLALALQLAEAVALVCGGIALQRLGRLDA